MHETHPITLSADLMDARDALSAAAALGVEIDAPAGTHVYQASTGWLSEEGEWLGLFSSEAGAYLALRHEVTYATDLDDEAPPWTDAPSGTTLRDWMAGKTDQDIVDTYYSHFRGENYSVRKIRISTAPTTR